MISKYSSEKAPLDLIRDTWQIIGVGNSTVLEIRGICPAGHQLNPRSISKLFRSIDYDTEQDLKHAVNTWTLRQNDLGYNMYIVMNSIKPSFTSGSACDEDIEFRDLLLIDLDRATDTKKPATDQEIEAAFEVAESICTFLKKRGMTNPIKVMSGNGVHIYFVLDSLKNDSQSKEEIQQLLCLLSREFDTPLIKVDRSVFNASRITKIPGTVMRKGAEQPDEGRIFRRAYVCSNN
jgi:hypothetical protein